MSTAIQVKWNEGQMTTMAQAVKEFLASVTGPVGSDRIKLAIHSRYPNQWKPSTLQAHLYACTVNNPKAYVHHPSAEKFMYRHSDGTFELYSEQRHGANEWVPQDGDDEVVEVTELAETTISLERDIEDHLINNLDVLEGGLKFVGRQVSTDVGRIDILAEDKNGRTVVIEIKVGDAKDSSVGQIARYLGWYAHQHGTQPRGLIVAAGFPEGIRYAAAAVPNLTLWACQVRFAFKQATIEGERAKSN